MAEDGIPFACHICRGPFTDPVALLLRNVHVDQGEGGGDGMSDMFQGYARRVEFSAKAGE